MPRPVFLCFELGIYVLFVICWRHAWVRGWLPLFDLAAGIIYGVVLEYTAILTLHAYSYGHFLIMLFAAVPLCIGVSWGLILYTAMATSDHFALPWYLRPIVDALLALTIDLSMDAIAIRLGFWSWGTAGPWFGVPLGNFYAWFGVVFSFSLLLRLGHRWILTGRLFALGDAALAIVAVPLVALQLLTLFRPYAVLVSQGVVAWLLIGLLVGGSGLLTGYAVLRTQHDHPLDLVLLSVPLGFHLFFFGALFWARIARQVPALIAISALMLGAGLLLHSGSVCARSPKR
jgi:carotenoid biosynthesis protein